MPTSEARSPGGGAGLLLPGFKGLSLKEFAKRLQEEVVNDNVADTAAQLSFYFLFSLFPFLFFLVTLSAYLPMQGMVNDLIDRAAYLMPYEALELVQGHLHSLISETRPKLLTLGFFAALWTASRGVDALRRALNLAYDVRETRPYLRTQVVSVMVTILCAMLILVAFAGLVAGGRAGEWLAEKANIERQFVVFWSFLRWPLTAVIVMVAVALAYYVLPDVEQEFRFVTPGSVLGTGVWIGSTVLFSWYVDEFAAYNVTYGSLAGVMILLLWLYLSSLIFLVGGEMNAVIEHASPDGKARGARVVGAPAATGAEQLAGKLPAAAKRASSGWRLLAGLWRRRPAEGGPALRRGARDP